MNAPEDHKDPKVRTSGRLQQKCVVCQNKDEEDLYIVFNILYRVIVGENFSKSFQGDEFKEALESIEEDKKEEEKRVSQEGEGSADQKFSKFKEMISRQILFEVIESSQFYHIFKELFTQKYTELQSQSCGHTSLAEYFVESFELPEQPQKGSVKKEKTLDNVTRLDQVYNAIQKLKTDVQSCHSDIGSISNHITEKLFKKPDESNKTIEEGDEESKNYSIENEIGSLVENNQNANDSSDKTKSGKGNNGSSRDGRNNSSSGSNENGGNNGGNGNSDKSTGESSSNNNNGQNDSSNGNGNGRDRSMSKSEQLDDSKNDQFKSKLPKKATDILKQWFLNNVSNPYPSQEAKETLSKMTGLSRKQIQNWFTNSRKRFLEPLKREIEEKGGNSRDGSRDRQGQKESKVPPFIPSEYQSRSPKNTTTDSKKQSNGSNKSPTNNTKDNIANPENIPSKSQTHNENQFKQLNNNFINQQQLNHNTPQSTPQNQQPGASQQQQPIYIQPVQYGFPMIQQPYNNGQNGGYFIVNPYQIQQSPYMYQHQQNQQTHSQPSPSQSNSMMGPQYSHHQGQPQQYMPVQPGGAAYILQQHNGVSYLVPIQGNYVDARNLMSQNLSTSFNTYNNNVYNNIGGAGYQQDQNAQVPTDQLQNKRPVLIQPSESTAPTMGGIGLQNNGINLQGNMVAEGSEKNKKGSPSANRKGVAPQYHQKPDLADQGPYKMVHKGELLKAVDKKGELKVGANQQQQLSGAREK